MSEDITTMEKLKEWNTLMGCVVCTTISTSIATDETKKEVVLLPEFSDFADVFKKSKIPLFPY